MPGSESQPGFSSTSFTVVRLEDIDEVARLRADLIAAYQPVNSQELFALEQMAIRQQALLRSACFERGLFSACLNESVGPDGSPPSPSKTNSPTASKSANRKAQNRNYCLADGFLRLARHSNGIQLFLRYRPSACTGARWKNFERVRKLRPELPNEPISEEAPLSEPEENSAGSTGGLAAGLRSEPQPSPPPFRAASQPFPLRPGSAGDLGGAGASTCQQRAGAVADVVNDKEFRQQLTESWQELAGRGSLCFRGLGSAPAAAVTIVPEWLGLPEPRRSPSSCAFCDASCSQTQSY